MNRRRPSRSRSQSRSTSIDPNRLVRPAIRGLHAYVPGEQPKVRGLIKLNTNENPYPPSTKVLQAVKAATDGRLRLYPSPTAEPLREKLARLHDCAVDQLIVGNGSDELLAMAVRAFVEPAGASSRHATEVPVRGPRATRSRSFVGERERERETVQFFVPSYSLYPVLADIHGARKNPVPLSRDFGLPPVGELERGGQWMSGAALTFVTTPNAPSGRGYARETLDALCRASRGIVVLDEAYVDFARENALELTRRHPHVLVARTFSKAYSLCFQRVGYFVGHAELIGALHRIRDSYNVNGLGQVAAEATLGDLGYYRRNFGRVIASRERLAAELRALDFEVHPSETNFLLVRPPVAPAREWLDRLRAARILVRWFDTPGLDAWLRISIGTEAEMETLVRVASRLRRRFAEATPGRP